MAREVWDVRLSTSAGDLVLPAPEMNRVISLLATAYSMAIFAISRLEGSAGCGSSAILRLASCAGCPIGVSCCPSDYVASTSGVPQKAADLPRRPTRQPWANSRQGFNHFGFAKSFATSRAYLMKSRATELSVRFFRVRIPVGTGAVSS